jgi:hypothetical protein
MACIQSGSTLRRTARKRVQTGCVTVPAVVRSWLVGNHQSLLRYRSTQNPSSAQTKSSSSRTPIVFDNTEAVNAELSYGIKDGRGHFPLGIPCVFVTVDQNSTAAVSGKIADEDPEMFCQQRHHLVPADVSNCPPYRFDSSAKDYGGALRTNGSSLGGLRPRRVASSTGI